MKKVKRNTLAHQDPAPQVDGADAEMFMGAWLETYVCALECCQVGKIRSGLEGASRAVLFLCRA